MAMTSLRDSASGGLMKFFLMGLLTLAVGGLVFTDMGGFFRGGITGNTNLAKVGSDTISIQKFDNSLARLLNRAGLSRQEAYVRGYTQQFLNEQIRETLTNQIVQDLGIVPGEEQKKEVVKTLIAPGVANGSDPETVLRQILAQQRMSETEFIQTLNNNIAKEPFTNALIKSSSMTSPLLVRDIVSYQNEKRDISYVIFKNSQAKNIEKPSNEQLRALYESTKESFASPETRDIQVIEIVFDAPKDMDENDILEEQYALADAVDDLAAGGATMQDIKEQTGAKLYDIKELDIFNGTHDQIIVSTAFDLTENEISPVFETDDGKFVAIAIKSINEKAYKPFESVENDIKKRWTKDQKTLNNKIQTSALASEIRAGKKKLSNLGTVSKKKGITRQSAKKTPFDPAGIGALFDAKPGQAVTLPVQDGIAIAIVTASAFPKTKKDSETAKTIETNVQKSIENETIILYLENKRKNIDIAINEALLKRAYDEQPTQ